VKRRRYELRDAELDGRIEELVARASAQYGDAGAEFLRQILVSGVRLVADGAALADLKLINSSL
jgi:hypothetical protein